MLMQSPKLASVFAPQAPEGQKTRYCVTPFRFTFTVPSALMTPLQTLVPLVRAPTSRKKSETLFLRKSAMFYFLSEELLSTTALDSAVLAAE
jgi:hypothetical protein